MQFPGPDPGKASARRQGDRLVLGNDVMGVSWSVAGDGIGPGTLTDRINGATLSMGDELFEMVCDDGKIIRSSDMNIVGEPLVSQPTVDHASPKLAERYEGKQVVVDLVDATGNIAVNWRAVLRDGANYVRQIVTLRAVASDLGLRDIVLMDVDEPGAEEMGTVDGSPVVAGNFFFGCEHPMARNMARLPAQEVGAWDPSTMSYPDRTQLRWKVTDQIDGIGRYQALFEYTGGDHRLEIFRVGLVDGDREIARDEHFGYTGTAHADNRYEFNLAHYNPKATYNLVAEVRSDGGTDSRGTVSMANLSGVRRIRAALPQAVSLRPGESMSASAVMGVAPKGQLRRGFLYYVERERAHPYRPFLHYNSWYDIGYFSKFDEADCLRVIDAFGTELVKRRKVEVDSFLLDDGWDDHETLWSFHKGLPRGFAAIKKASTDVGAAPGVWLSPWGGYGEPKKQRLRFGQSAGYETDEKGFVLSAPKYYSRFREICMTMIRSFGVNQFKFDGIGRSGGRYPGSEFGSDFLAAIQLITDLRRAEPDIFINLTTGTWPSPFWLRHADSIWRGGYDHEFTGVGSDRQKWMTYRDAMTYKNVVQRAPLYPLSSLMLHGIIYAKHARQLSTDPGDDLREEILSAFGCGTHLQEMYISPDLMTEKNWDDLARSARWARNNAATLRDTHWVGGDPAKLQVYGWASWSPEKGILVLRNPADEDKVFELYVGEAFELPEAAARRYRFTQPFGASGADTFEVSVGELRTIVIQPFEVLVFEALLI